MATYRVKLTKEEASDLQKIVNKSSHCIQTYPTAFILLNVDEGKFSRGKNTNARICKTLKPNSLTINRMKKKLIEKSLEIACFLQIYSIFLSHILFQIYVFRP
jgi:hypothetical protein